MIDDIQDLEDGMWDFIADSVFFDVSGADVYASTSSAARERVSTALWTDGMSRMMTDLAPSRIVEVISVAPY